MYSSNSDKKQHNQGNFQPSEKRYIIKGEIPAPSIMNSSNQIRPRSEVPSIAYPSPHKELLLSNTNLQQHDLSLSMSHGASQENHEREMISAEKSYAEASSKIMRIKQLELENRIKLQAIENERLTRFLEEQTQEVQRLQESLIHSHRHYNEDNSRQQQQLQDVLEQNRELQETVAAQNSHLVRLQEDKKNLAVDMQREIFELHADFKNHKVKDIGEQTHLMSSIKKDYDSKLSQLHTDFLSSQHSNQDLRNTNSDLLKARTGLEHKLSLMIEENNHLTMQMECLHSESKARETTLSEKLKRSQAEMASYRKRMDSDLQEHLRIFEGKLEEQRSVMSSEMGDQVTALSAQLDERDRQIYNLQDSNVDREKRDNEFRRQAGLSYQLALQEAQEHITIVMQERDVLLNELHNCKSQDDRLEKQVVKLSKQLVQREQALTKERALVIGMKEKEGKNTQLSEKIQSEHQKEVNGLRGKLEVLLRENETIALQVNGVERELLALRQEKNKIAEDYELQYDQIRSEVEAEKDMQADKMLEGHLEALQRECKNRNQLEQRLSVAQNLRVSLEQQIKKLKDNETLGDDKINGLIEMNNQYQKDRERYSNEAIRSKKESDAHQKRLKTVESNYKLELDSLTEKLRIFQMQDEQYQNDINSKENELSQYSQNIESLQEKCSHMQQMNTRLEKQNKDLTESLRQAQGQFRNHNDVITKQRLRLDNQERELKERNEQALRGFQMKENESHEQIEKLQQTNDELVTKYNSILKKDRDNRFRLKLLKGSRVGDNKQDDDDDSIGDFGSATMGQTMGQNTMDKMKTHSSSILRNNMMATPVIQSVQPLSLTSTSKYRPYNKTSTSYRQ